MQARGKEGRRARPRALEGANPYNERGFGGGITNLGAARCANDETRVMEGAENSQVKGGAG